MTIILLVTYEFGKTIRNKIVNFKEAANSFNSIYVGQDVSFCLKTNQCDWADYPICDPHHKQIITGDLLIVENNELRELLAKSSNYNELPKIKFSKALIEIATAADSCIAAIKLKTNCTTSNFKPRKEKVLAKVKEKV